MHNSKEFPEGITNGAHWYPISGGMQVKLVVRGRVEERGGAGFDVVPLLFTWQVNSVFTLICVSLGSGVFQFLMSL